ncbi:unnamed protein product, partial [Coregonus sp. 'balchen']
PQSSPRPNPNQPSPSPSYSPYPNPNPNPRPSPLYFSPPLLPRGGWGSEMGVSPAVQQVTPERRGPQMNHLNQLNHLNHLNQLNHLNHLNQWNHLKPLYSPPAQQTQVHRLLCSVCRRVFKSLPALNGHMRSHGGLRGQTGRTQTHRTQKEEVIPVSPVPMLMPVSVPVRLPASPHPCLEEERQEGEDEGRRERNESRKDKRRYHHRPSPLVLPCHSTRGAVVFQSILRSTVVTEAYYTAPPMLRPDREGTGLYSSLTTSDGDLVKPGEQPIKIKPRINVGIGFQAEVPPLQDQRHSHSDPHNALVLGVSVDDVMFQWSDKWSPVEKKLVNKAFMMYQKDFHRIQKMVGTKSVSQCVEYYYTWKRRLRLNVRSPVRLASTLPQPTMNGKMGLHTISTKNACQPIHCGSSCPLL